VFLKLRFPSLDIQFQRLQSNNISLTFPPFKFSSSLVFEITVQKDTSNGDFTVSHCGLSGGDQALVVSIFRSEMYRAYCNSTIPYLICRFMLSSCRRTHPHSSLMSGQCSTASQTCVLGTQPPVWHRNWSSEQSALTESASQFHLKEQHTVLPTASISFISGYNMDLTASQSGQETLSSPQCPSTAHPSPHQVRFHNNLILIFRRKMYFIHVKLTN
jgi:hypothetical protein